MLGRRAFRRGLVFLIKSNMSLLDKLRKPKKSQEKVSGSKELTVAGALEQVREVVGRVKKASYSDFEYLRREIDLMLSQPEKF